MSDDTQNEIQKNIEQRLEKSEKMLAQLRDVIQDAFISINRAQRSAEDALEKLDALDKDMAVDEQKAIEHITDAVFEAIDQGQS